MRRSPFHLACLFLGALLVPKIAGATWPVNGVAVGGLQARAGYNAACPDGSGGWYLVWDDRQVNPSHYDVYLQHLAPTGDPVLGWPSTGVVVSGGLRDELNSQLTPDGQGGVLVTWQDGRSGSWDIYAQRYTSGGAISPGWTAGGNLVIGTLSQQQDPRICSDGLGGAFVTWADDRKHLQYDLSYCLHLGANGTLVPSWPSDGLELSPTSSGVNYLIPDGTGGCLVAWVDIRKGGSLPNGIDVYAQHLLADGTLAPSWQSGGNLVIAGRALQAIIPDGTGGFFVSSGEITLASIPAALRFWLSRFTLGGVPASGWSLAGIPLQSTVGDRNELDCAADSMGGILACWDDGDSAGGDIYAVRILPNGSVAPGWTPNGMPISDPANPDEYEGRVGPDGLGGAYVAWEKVVGGTYHAYVQHLSAHGSRSSAWPAGGLPVSPSNAQQTTPKVVPDGFHNALVCWQEKPLMAQLFVSDGVVATDVSLASTDVRSDRVVLTWQGANAAGLVASVYRRGENEAWRRLGSPAVDGTDRIRYEDSDVLPGARYAYRLGYSEAGVEQFTSEAWVDVPAAAVFALEGFRPNPAVGELRVSFSLPREGQATLELLDLAGRKVVDQGVGHLGPGRHLLRLNPLERVAPGVYWLRLRQGTQQALRRAVVVG